MNTRELADLEWRSVRGYEGLYYVSSDGRVYNVRYQEEKVLQLHYSGFLCVNLSKNGESRGFQVHRLVADAFGDRSIVRCRVRHKNGDKSDNRIENLRIIPPPPVFVRKSFSERFWGNVQVADDNECWLWTGAKNGAGYGSLGAGSGRPVMAHRASWLIHFGEIHENGQRLVVMHKCDNKLCVNPLHLQLGTYSENTRDAIKKGIFSPPYGEIHGPKPFRQQETERQCKGCGVVKPISEFQTTGVRRSDGLQYHLLSCKSCCKINSKSKSIA